jgi:hypothetical protein
MLYQNFFIPIPGGKVVLAFEAPEHHQPSRGLSGAAEPVPDHGVRQRRISQPDSQFRKTDQSGCSR